MKVYQKITDLIGGTPLLELANLEAKEALPAKIYGKMEYFNPAGSVKDRIAKGMIDDAEAKGLLKPGSVIIEPTSGNTGIGLASIAAARGYRLIIAMPETMSVERRNLMKAYGAGKGTGRRDPEQLYSVSVHQPGKSGGSRKDHRRGDLG